MAATNAASPSAASDASPARTSSPFLALRPSAWARVFIASSAVYSALGKAKLSRTSFGFFATGGVGSGFRFAAAAISVVGSFSGRAKMARSGFLATAALAGLRAAVDLRVAALAGVALRPTMIRSLVLRAGGVALLSRVRRQLAV